MKNVKKNYGDACNEYLRLFCKKHGFDFEHDVWVAGEIGDIAFVGDCFVDMRTVITDIDFDAPENEFGRWYDYCMRIGELGEPSPNFRAWLKGCPRKSDEELDRLTPLRYKIEGLRSEFKKRLDETAEELKK
jgi:hypothetical protein